MRWDAVPLPSQALTDLDFVAPHPASTHVHIGLMCLSTAPAIFCVNPLHRVRTERLHTSVRSGLRVEPSPRGGEQRSLCISSHPHPPEAGPGHMVALNKDIFLHRVVAPLGRASSMMLRFCGAFPSIQGHLQNRPGGTMGCGATP